MNNKLDTTKMYFCKFNCPIKQKGLFNYSTLADDIDYILSTNCDIDEEMTYPECGETIDVDIDFDDVQIFDEIEQLIDNKYPSNEYNFCEKLCPLNKFIEELDGEGLLKEDKND
ncbi:hypothetical protein [Clostridium sp.]|uniref:hypothetical protein n=1 Tax=Clostridium sp. TaxID=1506 RepID=UPI002624065C|nr:hypothetical protein [Clostridium sp.]